MDNKNSFTFKCQCGCGIIKIDKLDWEDVPERCLDIAYYALAYNDKQDGIFYTIWHRIKFAWQILRGKEFRLYDILIEDKEFTAFKVFINEQ